MFTDREHVEMSKPSLIVFVKSSTLVSWVGKVKRLRWLVIVSNDRLVFRRILEPPQNRWKCGIDFLYIQQMNHCPLKTNALQFLSIPNVGFSTFYRFSVSFHVFFRKSIKILMHTVKKQFCFLIFSFLIFSQLYCITKLLVRLLSFFSFAWQNFILDSLYC